jgi:hypothetical protein
VEYRSSFPPVTNLSARDVYRGRHVLNKPFQAEDVESSFRQVLSVAHER